jgi:hypothetical protein
MHVFYFLTPPEHFEFLREVCASWRVPVGIAFRRFSPSGFDPGYGTCSWDEDLAAKYLEGGYSEIYLSTNGSVPEHQEDWEFPERELHDLMIVVGARLQGDELEKAYLRVFAKQSHCVPLYRKLRRALKQTMNRGMYAGEHHYKDMFYSDAAAAARMVGEFGGYEYFPEPIT